jgi:hypothetical protein
MSRSARDNSWPASGRYAHLSRPQRTPSGYGPEQELPFSFSHARTLLFIAVALAVGLGLLTLVPDLSASPGGAPSGQAEAEVADAAQVDPPAAPDAERSAGPPPTDVAAEAPTVREPEPAAVISPVFTPEVQHWAPKIAEWSSLYNLDPDIIATIMQIESCGDPGAASHAGAQGLFQVMPFHFDPGEDMLDPDTNARRGMAFYNRQLEYTGWDIYLSFAGYNGGYAASGSSYAYWVNETQRYYTWSKGIYDDAKAGLTESPTLQQWLAAGGGGGCQRAAQRLGI